MARLFSMVHNSRFYHNSLGAFTNAFSLLETIAAERRERSPLALGFSLETPSNLCSIHLPFVRKVESYMIQSHSYIYIISFPFTASYSYADASIYSIWNTILNSANTTHQPCHPPALKSITPPTTRPTKSTTEPNAAASTSPAPNVASLSNLASPPPLPSPRAK